MRKEELFNIIGEVDEQKVAAAGMAMNTKKKSRPAWVKWGAMAACLCLVVVGAFMGHNNDFGKMACGHTNHSITVTQNGVYFAETDSGVYFYNVANEETTEVAKFNGTFCKTTSGIYLLNNSSGELYIVENAEITNVGTLDYNSPDYIKDLHSIDLIDIQDNVAYWTSVYQDKNTNDIYKAVFATNLTTSEKSELLTLYGSNPFKGGIVAGNLYFLNRVENNKIELLNLSTYDRVTVYEMPEDFKEISNMVFYEDMIVFESSTGMYQLDYDTAEIEKLTDIIPTTNALDRVGNELYYVAERQEEVLISLNLQTGEVVELVEIEGHTYTELVACEGGYYFTDPSDTNGGLFYYDFVTGSAVQISK